MDRKKEFVFSKIVIFLTQHALREKNVFLGIINHKMSDMYVHSSTACK